MLLASLLLQAVLILTPAQAENSVNWIGKNRPQCQAPFVRNNPQLKRAIEVLAPAALLIKCGESMGSAAYLDTPSRRVIVSAEHIVSNYTFKNGEFKVGKVTNPIHCSVLNPVTKQWVAVNPAVPPQLGHPLGKLNLQAPNDWMVLALETPVVGVRGLEIAEPGDLKPDTEVLLIGAVGWSGKKQINCSYMNICTNRDQWIGEGFATYNYTDCSSTSGQSGGPLVIRDPRTGDFKAAAILSGSTVDLPRGSAYNKLKMSTSVIALDGPVLRAIQLVDEQARGR